MIRSRYIAIGLAVLVIVGMGLKAYSRLQAPATVKTAAPPSLLVDNSVAPDFAAVAQDTWTQFLAVFRARVGCFGDVHLRAAEELDSRAAYDPKTATVTVRVPGTVAMLQSGLIHDWAHHVEFQCAAQKELRPAFLTAQGLPASTVWRPDETPANTPESAWAEIPSEQYAEATIELVLGRRQIPTGARVSVDAVRVIGQWAAGH